MKSSLRQSMAWLHTWAGLLTGWLLYFVFVTGTFGYVNREVTRWMQPSGHSPHAPRPNRRFCSPAPRRDCAPKRGLLSAG